MDYRKAEEYYDKLCKELDNQFGKEISAGTLDTMHKLTGTIHYLDEMMDKGEDDYSERSYRGGRSYRYDGGRSYDDGRSMRRNRDSMNRYSRNYSGGFEDELRDLMNDTTDQHTKQAVMRMLENMK